MLFNFINLARLKPCRYHVFRHLNMELKRIREIPKAEGLVGIILRRCKEYRILWQIKGLTVPLEDREKQREKLQARIASTLFGQDTIVPSDFFFGTLVDPSTEAMGDELCPEAYPQGWVALTNPLAHKILLLFEEGMQIVIIDAHWSAHEDEEVKGGGVWKAVSVP